MVEASESFVAICKGDDWKPREALGTLPKAACKTVREAYRAQRKEARGFIFGGLLVYLSAIVDGDSPFSVYVGDDESEDPEIAGAPVASFALQAPGVLSAAGTPESAGASEAQAATKYLTRSYCTSASFREKDSFMVVITAAVDQAGTCVEEGGEARKLVRDKAFSDPSHSDCSFNFF